MFNLSKQLIKGICTNEMVYLKGEKYRKEGKIDSIRYDEERMTVTATVKGTNHYSINLRFDEQGNLLTNRCSCPAYGQYWGACKHIVAVLLEIMIRDEKGEFDKIVQKYNAKNLIDYFRSNKLIEKDNLEIVNLEVNYELHRENYRYLEYTPYLSLSIGKERLYKVKSIKKLIQSIETGEEIEYGKKFTFNPNIHSFKKEDQELIDIIKDLYDNEEYLGVDERRYSYYSSNTSYFHRNKLNLTDNLTKKIFNSLKNRKLNVKINGISYNNVEIEEKNLPIDLSITKYNEDLLMNINYDDDIIALVEDGEYFFFDNKIYRISEEQQNNFLPIYTQLQRNDKKSIVIPNEYKEVFVSELFPRIKKVGNVKVANEVESLIYKPDLEIKIYLDYVEFVVTAKVKFIYGEVDINPFKHIEKVQFDDDRILVRDIESENNFINIIERCGFKVSNTYIYLDDDDLIFDFIYDFLPKLQRYSEVFYSDNFKAMEVKDSTSVKSGIRLNKERDMLEFSFNIDGITDSEIKDVLESIRTKRKYYKLKDGSFIPLNMPELKTVGNIIDGLGLNANNFVDKLVEIPKYKALYIDEKIKEAGEVEISRNVQFKELVQNIKEPEDIDYIIPEEVDIILRKYQKFGFKWLKTLSSYEFGGILADDMGLGKTLQVLTFILSERKEKGLQPTLIVAPTSLVYNWYSEVEKFTPQLKVLIVSGNKNERMKAISKLNDYDLVITSYPLIRRDIEYYKDVTFRYCILDEAQHIKNATSQNAKSVKRINAKCKFALTGTPIENSLTELWSIFDFIMPSYLFNHKKFISKFEKPIVKNEDHEALNELKKFIQPFILRRYKKDVLKDLPDKIEHKLVAELTKDQKKLYIAYLEKIRGELEEEFSKVGFEKSQIKILAALTRLRQLCCHPGLFVEGYDGESGKLNLLSEIIDETIESGHRILLFSQFTSMLSIIKEMLSNKNIEYLYLDGSVKSDERGTLVNEFNSGKGSVFLISLKAGGTGLNLTGADTVIHFDPWWNPAVEEQATDRAYRIGQKNVVHVMKLITKGTIEEKIFKLQEEKKKMIESVINTNETLITKMSKEQVMDLFVIDNE